MTNKDASVIIGNIPIEGDDCYTIAEYQEAKARTIKALEQQPSEDCISRQAVDDAIYDYSRSCDVNYEQIMEFIDKLPSVTPRRDLAETSQDCISREEVQGLISRWLSDYLLDETREALETINYKVGDMPSVYPERPKGKWIIKDGKEQGYDIAGVKTWYIQIMCDKCGFIKTPIEGHMWQYHYCPNCGADMRGEENGK